MNILTLNNLLSSSFQAHLPILAINGINLVLSPTTKFLGILVVNKVYFVINTKDVCTKVIRGIGVCNELTSIMSFGVMRKLFSILINPFLTYCIEIWV